MKGLVAELGIQQEHVVMNYDNKSVIHLSKNHVFHELSKHIDVKLLFVRDIISKEDIIIKD